MTIQKKMTEDKIVYINLLILISIFVILIVFSTIKSIWILP